MGHRQCLARVQQELERSQVALWRPVAEFHYYGGREPLLNRSALSGAMAKALWVSDSGAPEKVEERIAEQIAQKTRDTILLIEIVHPITPGSEAEAQAVFTLVGELWTSLVKRALKRSRQVPAFLLVPIAYDKRGLFGYAPAARYSRKVISKLAQEREREGCLIEVLPELEAFRHQELEDFLVLACDKPRDQARRFAGELLRAGDNEAILARMDQMMTRWKQES